MHRSDSGRRKQREGCGNGQQEATPDHAREGTYLHFMRVNRLVRVCTLRKEGVRAPQV
jgi:hypothetical protein